MKTIYFGVKSALSILIVVLLILCCGSAAFGTGMTVFAAEAYTYQHDPTLNQSAMLDIAKDETAVYGFRPNDTGSLKQYADMDWTDAELVEQGRQDRIAYHQSIESMYALLYQMNYEQKSTEEIARAVSTKRNQLRLEAYKDDPEGLAVLKERNLEKYGHEEGPLPDELFEKYGSWEKVIDKAFSVNAGMDACLGLYDEYYPTYVMLGMIEDDSLLPHKVDLRDFNGKNYVTPVKMQNPFGTCWAFALAATAEECFLFDNDMGVPAGERNEQVNFSEKYIVWNIYHHITALDGEGGNPYIASQVGEGLYVDEDEKSNLNAVYDFGGHSDRAANLFMAGLGLMDEGTEVNGAYPFLYHGTQELRNNNKDESEELAEKRREFYYNRNKSSIDSLIKKGKFSSPDEFDQWFNDNWVPGNSLYENTFKYPCYSPVDDWTVPDGAEYLLQAPQAMVKSTKSLICPAELDENNQYVFNPAGLDSIRKELAGGHAVFINLFADRSNPDDEDLTEDCIINFDHWAQYYSDNPAINHGVTIIGYDDNYPKEYFTRTFDGHTVEGSTPPGNGAFIVKNSWGSGDCDPDDPQYGDFGYEQSGYFYLSYYDHSLNAPFTFEFYSQEEAPYSSLYYDQYDFLYEMEYEAELYLNEMKQANVFYADNDAFLGWISTRTVFENTTVYYEIYKNPEDGIPDSGTLLESGQQTFFDPGYKSIALDNKYFLEKGEKYAVVIYNIVPYYSDEDGEMTTYGLIFPVTCLFHEEDRRACGVVNEGESYTGYLDSWGDFSEAVSGIRELKYENTCQYYTPEEMDRYFKNGVEDILVDNLPIKAILIPASAYACPHSALDHIERQEPTAAQNGHTEYYICHLCGKWFEDAAGTKEITDHDSVILPALPEKPTEKPTDEPTDKHTEEPTDKPTEEPTDKPTEEPTEKPTDKPGEDTPVNPADKPSVKPAEEPAGSSVTPTVDPAADPEQTLPITPDNPKVIDTGDHSAGFVVVLLFAFSALTIILIPLIGKQRTSK